MTEQQQIEQQIARTIMQQIKGNDFWSFARWGAKQFISLNEGTQKVGYILGGLQFSVRAGVLQRGGKVIVYLMGDDTYTVRAIRIRGTSIAEVKTVDGVYFDMLNDVIDRIIKG